MADEKQIHTVGQCRICGTGPLGLRECGQCGEIVVLCEECDAVWTDGNFSAKPLLAGKNDLPCPYCETSLLRPPSHWATKSKIEKLAWLQTALSSGELALQQSAPARTEPGTDA